MKIRELKKILDSYSDETEIVLSKDGEGNSFSPLFSTTSKCLYVAGNEFQGKIQSLPDGLEDAEVFKPEMQARAGFVSDGVKYYSLFVQGWYCR